MTDYSKLKGIVNALQLGERVPGFGEIVGVRCDGAERYYFLVDDYGTVAFIPASAIEQTEVKK